MQHINKTFIWRKICLKSSQFVWRDAASALFCLNFRTCFNQILADKETKELHMQFWVLSLGVPFAILYFIRISTVAVLFCAFIPLYFYLNSGKYPTWAIDVLNKTIRCTPVVVLDVIWFNKIPSTTAVAVS